MPPTEPFDIERELADPAAYERTIMRLFTKRSQRGHAFAEAARGVSNFTTASERGPLARAIAHTVASGRYRTNPVDLWYLETNGKVRAAHTPEFVDHIIGSTLFVLLSHNARCHGLPGVYSYLPGVTNLAAMQTFAATVREHRARRGPHAPPIYVIQSDFEKYGDNLPVGPDAALWTTLRAVADLGSPSGEIAPHVWDLITGLVRPVVREADGTEFTRFHGVAMGTPLVPLLGNLAVVPMDRAISAIDGVFYARYNDDFIIAHSDLTAIHEADRRIDSLTAELGVKRKLSKEIRTALIGSGRSGDDPAYRGRDRIDCLGLTVTSAGTVNLGPHRLRRFIERVSTRIDGAAKPLSGRPLGDKLRHLVAATNVMLDVSSPFAVTGVAPLLQATTDRGTLKDLDFRISRKIVQAATGQPGVRGFRQVPPAVLRAELGLVSLVQLRNQQ